MYVVATPLVGNCWLVNDRCLRPHVRGLKQADTALGLDDKGVEAFLFQCSVSYNTAAPTAELPCPQITYGTRKSLEGDCAGGMLRSSGRASVR
jgi:hypothetical protein